MLGIVNFVRPKERFDRLSRQRRRGAASAKVI
jgi:hypothetical protein